MNNRRSLWRLALVVSCGLSLASFWLVLGYRYSPETYTAKPVHQDTVEQLWLGFALLVAVATAATGWSDSKRTRQMVLACLPLATVGVWVLGKMAIGGSLKSYDAMLFSAASGFVVMTLARRSPPAARPNPRALGAVVWGAALLLTGYFLWQQFRALDNLALGYHDCGEAARILHNTLFNPRELFLRINPERPLFQDHFQPGILPLVVFWAMWPKIGLTILFQVLTTLGTAVPLYLLGRAVAKDETSGLLLAAAWLVYPSTSQVIYSGSYGFYFGNFCLPLYVLALWFWVRGRAGWALAAAAWAILIKEEAAIYVGMFGLYLALFQKRRVAGSLLLVSAFAYFWVMTAVIIPALSGGGYQMMAYFSELGATHWQVLLSPWTRPQIFWGKVFEPATFYLLGCWLAPLLFLPLRRPSILVIGSLPFLFICLWHDPNWKSICYHYQFGILVVLFWALIEGQRAGPAVPNAHPSQSQLWGVVAAGVTLSIFLGHTAWSKQTLFVQEFPGRRALVERMAHLIAKDSTLVVTERAGTYFVDVKYLWLVPHLPPATDYVLLDMRDGWRLQMNADLLHDYRQFQQKVEAAPQMKLLAADDGLLLYGRRGIPLDARAAVERDRMPVGVTPDQLPLVAGLEVAGVQLENLPSGRVRVHVFSTARSHVAVDLAARCVLRFAPDEEYGSALQPLGQGVWPTFRWQPGRLYEDAFDIPLPPGLQGQKCQISFAVEDLNQHAPAAAEAVDKRGCK